MKKFLTMLLVMLTIFSLTIPAMAATNIKHSDTFSTLVQQLEPENNDISIYEATKGNGVSTISAAFGSGLIRRGSKGNYVKYVQLCLCARGINVDVDGIFGAKTEEAVMDYQALMYLDDDGIVGQNTKNAFWNDPECYAVIIREGF